MKLDKSYKVKVNPEQSREIQELLSKKPQYVHCGYLAVVINSNNGINMVHSMIEEVFKSWNEQEINAPELIALLSQKETKMTNLSDFLKCKKVRCVDNDGMSCIEKGEEYKVIGIDFKIKTKCGHGIYHAGRFEPVLETAIQATEKPASEPLPAEKPKLEVGDRVYCIAEQGKGIVYTIANTSDLTGMRYYSFTNNPKSYKSPFVIFHATPENYEMLCKLYPHIEFEKPKQELIGSDLCRAMLDKGWNCVPCYVADHTGDNYALRNKTVELIHSVHNNRFYDDNLNWRYAVPFDPKTGNPLTSEVLDDQ